MVVYITCAGHGFISRHGIERPQMLHPSDCHWLVPRLNMWLFVD
jgi:hypothetical protein